MKIIIDGRYTNLFPRENFSRLKDRSGLFGNFDSDGTLIPLPGGDFERQLQGNMQALCDTQDSFLLANISTARGPSGLRKKAEFYRGMPLFPLFASPNMGRDGIYHNNTGANAQQWIEGLPGAHPLDGWGEFASRNLKWNLGFVRSQMQKAVLEEGFEECEGEHYIFDKFYRKRDQEVFMINDQALFSLKRHGDFDQQKELVSALSEAMLEQIKSGESNIDVGYTIYETSEYFFIDFFPYCDDQPLSKLKALEIFLNMLDEKTIKGIRAIVNSGDDPIDDHLKLTEVEFKGVSTVPAISIHAGDRLLDLEGFKDHPHMFVTKRGDIGDAIRQAVREV